MRERDGNILCVEIGGTNLRWGVTDPDNRLLTFEKISSADFSEADDKGAYLEWLLNPARERYGGICLSLSLASLMDRDRTICYNSPNLKGMDHLPLKTMLEERFRLPVVMERDVNTSLLYELRKQRLNAEGIVIGIFIGTGLGNAMSIDGKIYRGYTGSSCELGHIPLYGLNETCGCGKKGCLELKGSGRTLATLAEEKYHCAVEDIFTLHGEEAEVREVVRICAAAAATEITILDPVCVILGGGVTKMRAFPEEYFRKCVKENLRIPNPRESLRIIPASDDPEAGVVGAALNAENILALR